MMDYSSKKAVVTLTLIYSLGVIGFGALAARRFSNGESLAGSGMAFIMACYIAVIVYAWIRYWLSA